MSRQNQIACNACVATKNEEARANVEAELGAEILLERIERARNLRNPIGHYLDAGLALRLGLADLISVN